MANNYTTTALKRWSVGDLDNLPAISDIKALHVYDFDNTLFNSPTPNPKLWNGPTIGYLQTLDSFTSGGWWHDSRILASTGDGLEKEESKAWKGWWNEQIVELIMLSVQQKDALTILLTGRSEAGFTTLIKRMVKSRNMEFDMVVLKPKAGPNGQRFASTMAFKQVFLETLMETYKNAEEIRLYEDRVKHVKGFRDFFMDYNKRQNGIGGHKITRGPLLAEVIQVAEGTTTLDPVIEVAEVQKMINEHNDALLSGTGKGRPQQIKKTVFYTGYLISNTDSQQLLTLVNLPPNMPESEMKFLANNVLITPRPAPNSILEKVGGMGNKLLWEVTGTAVFENKIWAANVRPVPSTAPYYSENPVPIVVLALRKGARPIDAARIQNWQPVPQDKAYIFETTVGEKVLLRVEDQDPKEGEYESLFPSKTNKRKHQHDDENGSHGNRGRGNHGGQYGGRGGGPRGGRGGHGRNDNNRNGRGGNRGGGGGGRNGRGRGGGGNANSGGGHPSHRSLDDIPNNQNQNNSQNAFNATSYDDFPALGNHQANKNFNQNHQQPQQQGGYQSQGYAAQQPYQQNPPHAQQQNGYGGGYAAPQQQQQGFAQFGQAPYQPQSNGQGQAQGGMYY